MISVQQVTVHYDQTQALWDICLDKIPAGQLVGVIGPNGGGKSTFLKVLMGLIKPISGKVCFSDPEAKKKIAYVPQKESVDWEFPITAFELVLMGRYGQLRLFQRPRKADIEAAKAALEKVKMLSFADRQINQLSGGQQQRLFFARALMQNADIYLLDEPFSGIDVSTEKILMDLLKTLRDQGKTILIVHHDLTTVRDYFDWLILLNTRLIASGPTQEVFQEGHLIKCFGKHPALFEEVVKLSERQTSGIL